ncbi:P-loop nucleotide/nucleoside kinase family protein [Flindersiella endophytica]
MATAHLIYGYIGAGKSTFAARLERELPAIRFSTDEWIGRLYSDDETEIADFGVLVDRVERVMEPVWTQCLRHGIDVVLDQGFWARSKRDRVRALVAACGAESRLHHVVCDDELAWSRVEARNADLGGSIRMSRNTFEVLRTRLEPLGIDEPHTVLRTDGSGSGD